MTSQAAALSIEDQHRAILACCDQLLAALRASTTMAEIGQVRMRLAGLLQDNLASEDGNSTVPSAGFRPIGGRTCSPC